MASSAGADHSLPDYDESAAMLLKRRVLSFLDTIDQRRSLRDARSSTLEHRSKR